MNCDRANSEIAKPNSSELPSSYGQGSGLDSK